MIVDCDRCEVRGNACQDCVITVLLGAPPGGVELDGAERRALDTLADAGMVPRLQLVDRGDDHNKAQIGSVATCAQELSGRRLAVSGTRGTCADRGDRTFAGSA